MLTWRLLPIGALALIVGMASGLAPAPAAQAPTPLVAKSDTQNGVTEARYERRGYRRGRIGRGVGVGIGLGILGGIVAAEAYRPRAGYYYDDEAYDGPYYAPTGYAGDPRNLCAQNFRSFEWNTGLLHHLRRRQAGLSVSQVGDRVVRRSRLSSRGLGSRGA